VVLGKILGDVSRPKLSLKRNVYFINCIVMSSSKKIKKKDSSVWGVAPNGEWNFKEWQKFEHKLWRLSLSEMADLMTAVGAEFTIGNKNIKKKEEFILVMDEAEKVDLLREYERVIKERK
jgi:hypothetical protein